MVAMTLRPAWATYFYTIESQPLLRHLLGDMNPRSVKPKGIVGRWVTLGFPYSFTETLKAMVCHV